MNRTIWKRGIALFVTGMWLVPACGGDDATSPVGPGANDAAPDTIVPVSDANLPDSPLAPPDSGHDSGRKCAAPSDCALHQTCNLTTGLCDATCGASEQTACNGGCCNAGVCVGGAAATACGASGGACTTCLADGSTTGSVCLPSGSCGCTSASDCPTDKACDTATGTCTATCSASQPCNEGCCNAGACTPGNSASACGISGGACTSCVNGDGGPSSSNGSSCLSNGTCGCANAADCEQGEACDTTTGQCTTSCSSSQACNGGCCSAATGGTCIAGAGDTACGGTGGVCASCTGTCPTGGSCACGKTNANTCGGSLVFSYTGGNQTFVVPAGITHVTVTAVGASGGNATNASDVVMGAGLGGSTTATIAVTPGEMLVVMVGAQGQGAHPNFNGGASGIARGGDASDVRQGGDDLAHRVIVAGGGGGAGVTAKNPFGGDVTKGGDGGGLAGEDGQPYECLDESTGGTATAGGAGAISADCSGGARKDGAAGALGLGGAGGACAAGGGSPTPGGGGGGGYYGGGGGACYSVASDAGVGPPWLNSGAGGSSFAIATATSVSMVRGGNTGDGKVTITW